MKIAFKVKVHIIYSAKQLNYHSIDVIIFYIFQQKPDYNVFLPFKLFY